MHFSICCNGSSFLASVALETTLTYESLRANYTPSERIILDRSGAPIQHIRTALLHDDHRQRRVSLRDDRS